MGIIINITEDEEKILKTDIADIEEWLNNFVRVKINSLCHRYILEMTDKRPDRMSYEDKIKEVVKLNIKSAIEKNKEII